MKRISMIVVLCVVFTEVAGYKLQAPKDIKVKNTGKKAEHNKNENDEEILKILYTTKYKEKDDVLDGIKNNKRSISNVEKEEEEEWRTVEEEIYEVLHSNTSNDNEKNWEKEEEEWKLMEKRINKILHDNNNNNIIKKGNERDDNREEEEWRKIEKEINKVLLNGTTASSNEIIEDNKVEEIMDQIEEEGFIRIENETTTNSRNNTDEYNEQKEKEEWKKIEKDISEIVYGTSTTSNPVEKNNNEQEEGKEEDHSSTETTNSNKNDNMEGSGDDNDYYDDDPPIYNSVNNN